jgi:hypothetical protein
MANYIEYAKTNWKQLAVVAAVFCAFGYGSALLTRPDKIVEKEKIKVVSDTKIVYRIDQLAVDEAIENWKKTNKTYGTQTVVIKTPCPSPDTCPPNPVCQETTIVTNWGSDSTSTGSSSTTSTTNTTAAGSETTRTQTDISKEKTTINARPNWLATVRAGVEPSLTLNLKHDLAVGGDISRRVWGPLFLGGWTLRLPDSKWYGGVSVTMEW